MNSSLKKKLDNTPKQVYNICKKDGEGFDLSPIPNGYAGLGAKTYLTPAHQKAVAETLEHAYKLVRETYLKHPDLFPTPPVFAGGFFRDIVWQNAWPNDLDLFFNSYGMGKEEAEDNLCLFFQKMGVPFKEQDSHRYAGQEDGMENVFRVFNFDLLSPRSRCSIQAILKDLGPPSDDPLYVTQDFHYNHAKAAMPVVGGQPEIHYHGHAVFGWEEKCHVAFRKNGLAKCADKFYGLRGFKRFDLSTGEAVLPEKPKSDVKMPTPLPKRDKEEATRWLYGGNPIVPDPLSRPEAVLEHIREAQRMRNEFVNQFVPDNRRPVP